MSLFVSRVQYRNSPDEVFVSESLSLAALALSRLRPTRYTMFSTSSWSLPQLMPTGRYKTCSYEPPTCTGCAAKSADARAAHFDRPRRRSNSLRVRLLTSQIVFWRPIGLPRQPRHKSKRELAAWSAALNVRRGCGLKSSYTTPHMQRIALLQLPAWVKTCGFWVTGILFISTSLSPKPSNHDTKRGIYLLPNHWLVPVNPRFFLFFGMWKCTSLHEWILSTLVELYVKYMHSQLQEYKIRRQVSAPK